MAWLTVGFDAPSQALINKLINLLTSNLIQGNKLMSTLQDDIAAIAAQTTAIGSLTTFIAGLEAQIANIGGLTADQQAAVDAIFANVNSNTAAIQAAMVTNVPPAPNPGVVPPVAPVVEPAPAPVVDLTIPPAA